MANSVVKWGGTYRAISSGKMAVKWGGIWWTPSRAYVKWAGSWYDTGYSGYPGAPTGLYITYWDYTQATVSFTPPSGGAPVAAYHYVLTDNVGTWLAETETAAGSFNFTGLAQDSQYQIFVRSKGATGLYSTFAGPLRIQIGHPSTVTTTYPSRHWESPVWAGTIFQNEAPTVDVPNPPGTGGDPAGVTVTDFHCHVSTPHSSQLDNGVGNRAFWIINGNVSWQRLTNQPSPYNVDQLLDIQPPAFGFLCSGAGWSQRGVSTTQYVIADFFVAGTEVYRQDDVNPAVGNSYW